MTKAPWAPSRRDFLKAAGLTAAQMELLWSSAIAQEHPTGRTAKGGKRAPNILLIVNDQERYVDKLPPKYRLPGCSPDTQSGPSWSSAPAWQEAANSQANVFAVPERPLRIVAVEALVGGRSREAFYSTIVDATAEQVQAKQNRPREVASWPKSERKCRFS